MNLKDLKPASQFANSYGLKTIVYGPPGSGKTPLINTAPRPVLLATEPGLLSMRGSQVPTFAASTGAAIDDFFKWAFHSAETKNFDTICVDSISMLAEIYLLEALNGKSKSGNKAHGQAAYGDMAKATMEHLRGLYFLQNKHTLLIAKQEIYNASGMDSKRPYFPGKYLPVELPHLYDAILHFDIHNIPGMGQYKSFQCQQTIDVMARNRTGNLDMYEESDFGKLVAKAMQI